MTCPFLPCSMCGWVDAAKGCGKGRERERDEMRKKPFFFSDVAGSPVEKKTKSLRIDVGEQRRNVGAITVALK